MKNKKLSTALFLSLLALPVAASAQSIPSAVIDGETIGTPELVQKACAEGQVSYYTSEAEGQTREVTAVFEKRFPCIKVLTVSAVTGRLTERIAAEVAANKLVVDVALLNDPQAVDKFKSTGVISPWNPPSADKYPAAAKLDGWYYAAGANVEYIAYNTNLVSDADAPKSWKDLLNPKWRGKIAAPTVAIGGTGWLQYYFLQQTYGPDFLAKLGEQKPKYFSSYQPLGLSVARGETAVALITVSVEAPMRLNDGAPLKAAYPADGMPVVPNWLFILKNSPHPNAAMLFANWALSKEAQAAGVRVRKIWSQRPDVAPAEGNPDVSTLKFWNLPPETMIREFSDFSAKATKALGQE